MTGHTPGPWSVNASLGHRIYTEGKGCTLIATPGYLRDGGAEVANARLIAAAPDLLAACQEVMRGRRVRLLGQPDGCGVTACRAAIAKAEAA